MVIRIRKSKKDIQWSRGQDKSGDLPEIISCRRYKNDRQYNVHNKQEKKTNNDIQLNIEQHKLPHSKWR
jgi:hypothetical protein